MNSRTVEIRLFQGKFGNNTSEIRDLTEYFNEQENFFAS